MENNELRQAINNVEVTGIIKEHKLNEGKGDKGKYINGSLVIKAGEFTEIEMKVFVNEKNKDGKVKKGYTTLKSMLDGDLKTMANAKEGDEVTKVRIYGRDAFTAQIKEEIFKVDGKPEPVEKTTLDLGFGNIAVDSSIQEKDYKATFDIEMYVAKIEEEVKSDEETGRVLIKGYVPLYGGQVMPLIIVAGKVVDEEGEYDFAEDVRVGIEEGQTINLWGNINHKSIIEKVKKGGGLGRAKIEENRTYIREFIAVGGTVEEDSEKEFDADLISKAITERDIKIEEEKNKESKSKNSKKGLTGKNNKSSDTKKPSIPF